MAKLLLVLPIFMLLSACGGGVDFGATSLNVGISAPPPGYYGPHGYYHPYHHGGWRHW